MTNKKIKTADVTFQLYTEPAKESDILKPGNAATAKPIKNRWIYIFRENPQYVEYTFTHEIYVDDSGNYHLVDLKKNFKMDSRPYGNNSVSTIKIDIQETRSDVPEHLFFDVGSNCVVSRIQLPWKRLPKFDSGLSIRARPDDKSSIDKALAVRDWLQARKANYLRVGVISNSENIQASGDKFTVNLWDPLDKAAYYHNLFIYYRDKYLEWVSAPEIYKKKYILDTVEMLEKQAAKSNKSILQHLNTGEYYRMLGEIRGKHDGMVHEYQDWAARLCSFKKEPQVEEVWADFLSAKQVSASPDEIGDQLEKIQSDLATRINESRAGDLYLSGLIRDKDSALNVNTFNTTRRFTVTTGKLLEAVTASLIKTSAAESIARFKKVLKDRAGIDFSTVKFNPFRNHPPTIGNVTAPVIEIFQRKSLGELSKTITDTKVAQAIFSVVEVFNFGISIAALAGSKNTPDVIKNLISVAGSLADFVTGFYFISKKLGEKAILKFGVVSGMCDAIVGGWNLYDEVKAGDYNQAAGHGLEAVGGLTMAAGSYLAIKGGVITITGVGAIPGTVIIFIGAITMAIGTVIAWLADNDELEDWLLHCYLGKRYGLDSASKDWSAGDFLAWKDNLDLQISALNNIFYRFDLKATFSYHPAPKNTYCTLTIIPNTIHEFSVARVDAKHSGSLGLGNFADLAPLNNPTLKKNGEKIEEVSVTWSAGYEIETLTVKVQLDIMGDGKILYPPDKPKEQQFDKPFFQDFLK